MDLVKTLQSIEDLIYELVVWIVLAPKTLFKIIFKPSWIQSYVTKEWKKTSEKRFSDYLSPVIFWLLVAVIPFAILTFTPVVNQNGDYSGAIEEKSLFQNTFLMLISPLVYFVWVQKLLKKPFEKIASKRLFYIQCYCHAPIQFANVLINIFAINTTYFNILSSAMILWLLIVEVVVFRDELKVGFIRAIVYAILPQFLLFFIAVGFLVFFDKSGIIGAFSAPK